MAHWYLLKGSSEYGIQNIIKSLPPRVRDRVVEMHIGGSTKKRVFCVRFARRHVPFLQRLSKNFGYSVEEVEDEDPIRGFIENNKGGNEMNHQTSQEKAPVVGKAFEGALHGDTSVLDREEESSEDPSSQEPESQEERILEKGAGSDDGEEGGIKSSLSVAAAMNMIQEQLELYNGKIAGLHLRKEAAESAIQELQSEVQRLDKRIELVTGKKTKFVDGIMNVLSS